jgi:hypothetical protein
MKAAESRPFLVVDILEAQLTNAICWIFVEYLKILALLRIQILTSRIPGS